MPEAAAWIALFVFVALAAVKIAARHDTAWGPILVFATASFLYYLSVPLEMIATGNGSVRADIADLVVPEPIQARMVRLGTLAFVSFCAGYLVSATWFCQASRRAWVAPLFRGSIALPPSLLPMTILFLALGGALIVGQVGLLADYAARVELFAQSSNLFFVLFVAAIIYPVAAFALVHCYRLGLLAAATLFAPGVLWGLLIGSKYPIVLSVLGLATLVWRFKLSQRAPVMVVLAVAGVLVSVPASIAFSLYRGDAEIDIVRFVEQNGLYRYSDQAGPMLTLIDVLEKPDEPLLRGRSYLQGLVLWVPRFLWPDRPIDLAESWARTNIADWSEGVGVGYSLLAESIANFGRAGPVVTYLGLGILWNLFWFGIVRRLVASDVLFAGLHGVFGYYLLITMHRGPFSGIVTTIMQTLGPVIAIQLVLDMGLRKRAAASPAVNPVHKGGRLVSGG